MGNPAFGEGYDGPCWLSEDEEDAFNEFLLHDGIKIEAMGRRMMRRRRYPGIAALLVAGGVFGYLGHNVYDENPSPTQARPAPVSQRITQEQNFETRAISDGFTPTHVRFTAHPALTMAFEQYIGPCGDIDLSAEPTAVITGDQVSTELRNSYTLSVDGSEVSRAYTNFADLSHDLGPDMCSGLAKLQLP